MHNQAAPVSVQHQRLQLLLGQVLQDALLVNVARIGQILKVFLGASTAGKDITFNIFHLREDTFARPPVLPDNIGEIALIKQRLFGPAPDSDDVREQTRGQVGALLEELVQGVVLVRHDQYWSVQPSLQQRFHQFDSKESLPASWRPLNDGQTIVEAVFEGKSLRRVQLLRDVFSFSQDP